MTIIYKYDAKTGHIEGQTSGEWEEGNPALSLPNQVVVNDLIPAVVTTTFYDGTFKTENYQVNSGWSFILDEKGNPTKNNDGDYIIAPIPLTIPSVDKSDYILKGLIKAGFLDVSEIDHGTLNQTNWALNASGAPIIENTNLVALPVRTATVSKTG